MNFSSNVHRPLEAVIEVQYRIDGQGMSKRKVGREANDGVEIASQGDVVQGVYFDTVLEHVDLDALFSLGRIYSSRENKSKKLMHGRRAKQHLCRPRNILKRPKRYGQCLIWIRRHGWLPSAVEEGEMVGLSAL